jgi:hypothetical protein
MMPGRSSGKNSLAPGTFITFVSPPRFLCSQSSEVSILNGRRYLPDEKLETYMLITESPYSTAVDLFLSGPRLLCRDNRQYRCGRYRPRRGVVTKPVGDYRNGGALLWL